MTDHDETSREAAEDTSGSLSIWDGPVSDSQMRNHGGLVIAGGGNRFAGISLDRQDPLVVEHRKRDVEGIRLNGPWSLGEFVNSVAVVDGNDRFRAARSGEIDRSASTE